MDVVAEHFIELSVTEQHRKLTPKEQYEKRECLKYLEKQLWKLAKLKNLSLMASMTNNADWQHEICAEIEKIEGR